MENNLPDKNRNGIPDPIERWYMISTVVRGAVVIWSAVVLTFVYFEKADFDTTFIASVFSGTLATFGVEVVNKKKQ